jgi:hypothetical protein
MIVGPDTLKLGLVFFWSLWITLVFLTNLFEGLKILGVLPEGWRFVSGNYKYVSEATSAYDFPHWVTGLLFVGVVFWEGLVVVLFWRAATRYAGSGSDAIGFVDTAFTVNIGLWAAFMFADELFRAYRQQTTHVLLLISQLVSLLAIHLLPG